VGLQIIGPMPSATCWDREFADSPLEGSGFELLVPLGHLPQSTAERGKRYIGLTALSDLAGAPDDARLLGRRGKGGVRFSFIRKRLLGRRARAFACGTASAH
jgi:hypothetical protein